MGDNVKRALNRSMRFDTTPVYAIGNAEIRTMSIQFPTVSYGPGSVANVRIQMSRGDYLMNESLYLKMDIVNTTTTTADDVNERAINFSNGHSFFRAMRFSASGGSESVFNLDRSNVLVDCLLDTQLGENERTSSKRAIQGMGFKKYSHDQVVTAVTSAAAGTPAAITLGDLGDQSQLYTMLGGAGAANTNPANRMTVCLPLSYFGPFASEQAAPLSLTADGQAWILELQLATLNEPVTAETTAGGLSLGWELQNLSLEGQIVNVGIGADMDLRLMYKNTGMALNYSCYELLGSDSINTGQQNFTLNLQPTRRSSTQLLSVFGFSTAFGSPGRTISNHIRPFADTNTMQGYYKIGGINYPSQPVIATSQYLIELLHSFHTPTTAVLADSLYEELFEVSNNNAQGNKLSQGGSFMFGMNLSRVMGQDSDIISGVDLNGKPCTLFLQNGQAASEPCLAFVFLKYDANLRFNTESGAADSYT